MNILYKLINKDGGYFSCDYILENKDYYILIHCRSSKNNEIIKSLSIEEKRFLSYDDYCEDWHVGLHEHYKIILATDNNINLEINNAIKW